MGVAGAAATHPTQVPAPRRGLLAFFLSGLAWLGRALRYRRAPRSVPEMTYWRVVGWPGCS